MKSGRFFVTYVSVLAIFVLAALNANRIVEERVSGSPALVEEGNAKLKESEVVRQELQNEFGIRLLPSAIGPEKFDWKELTLEKRLEAQGRIAQYLQLVNRVLEIGTKRLITIENRENLLVGRDSAQAFQRSGENFLAAHGESLNPKSVAGQSATHISELEN